jgi:hypothetical protein
MLELKLINQEVFIMRKCLVLSLILGVCFSTALFAKSLVDIEGTYQCKGNDPTLTPADYTAKMKIVKQGAAYILNEVDLSNGSFFYKQVALRQGNVLSMAYQQSNMPAIFGVQSTVISHDGKTLTGTFTYFDQHTEVGHEICTRIAG